jgi:hypothetical protein
LGGLQHEYRLWRHEKGETQNDELFAEQALFSALLKD